jgi:putative flippase GtrA
MSSKIKRVATHRVSKFAVVGVVNTLTDLVLLNILRIVTHTESGQTGKLIVLNIMSASTVAVMSFYLNRKYVFNAHDTKNHMFVPFLLITLSSIFIIQSLVIAFALHFFDPLATVFMNIGAHIPIVKNFSFNFYEANIAKVCATAASMVWNYIWYNKFVFKSGTSRKA